MGFSVVILQMTKRVLCSRWAGYLQQVRRGAARPKPTERPKQWINPQTRIFERCVGNRNVVSRRQLNLRPCSSCGNAAQFARFTG